MPNRLNELHDARHNSYIDFMRAVINAGFDNELDNARVIKTLTEKVSEVWTRVERKGSYFITSMFGPHVIHGEALTVTVHSDVDEAVKVDTILFVRQDRDSLAIGRDVIGEEFMTATADIPFSGMLMDIDEARKHFQESKRFNEPTIMAFEATYKALSSVQPSSKCLLRLTPTATGLDVKFTVDGKKLTRLLFEYSPK
jgi:hypothetical protein